MAYATSTDATDLYGEDYILNSLDRDEDGEADVTAFTDSLDQATSELNTYIGVRYDLPLPTPVEAVLVRFCIDVAVYISSPGAGTLTEEKTNRYKDAIAWAKGLAKGDISLGIEDEDSVTGSEGSAEVSSNNPTRLFTRTTMGGLF